MGNGLEHFVIGYGCTCGSFSMRLNAVQKAINVAPINIPSKPQSDKKLFENNIIDKTFQQMNPKTQERKEHKINGKQTWNLKKLSTKTYWMLQILL